MIQTIRDIPRVTDETQVGSYQEGDHFCSLLCMFESVSKEKIIHTHSSRL